MVTDRESSYQRIAQSYFETFASALLKVLIANCATLNAHHPQSNPRLIGEEATDLLHSMTGILIFDGAKHSASSDDFISSGFFGFHYPISPAEVISKIMSMDQIMHDLPCDPVEAHILAEFQSGLAGSGIGEDKLDVGLLESLALSLFFFFLQLRDHLFMERNFWLEEMRPIPIQPHYLLPPP